MLEAVVNLFKAGNNPLQPTENAPAVSQLVRIPPLGGHANKKARMLLSDEDSGAGRPQRTSMAESFDPLVDGDRALVAACDTERVKQLSLVIVQDSRKLVGSSLPGQEDSQSQQCERSDAEAKDVAESAGGLAGRRAEETVARRASQAQHEAHARAAELDRQVQQKEHELREQASLRVSQAAAAGDDLSKCANLAADATASASPGSAAASSTQPLERYVVSGAGAPAVDGEYVPASFLVFGLVYSPWMCG